MDLKNGSRDPGAAAKLAIPSSMDESELVRTATSWLLTTSCWGEVEVISALTVVQEDLLATVNIRSCLHRSLVRESRSAPWFACRAGMLSVSVTATIRVRMALLLLCGERGGKARSCGGEGLGDGG